MSDDPEPQQPTADAPDPAPADAPRRTTGELPAIPPASSPPPRWRARVIAWIDRAIELYRAAYEGWLRTKERLIPTERQRLFGLTIAIGVACGIAAVAFHLTIQFVERHTIERAIEAPGYDWIWGTILVPAAGAVLAGLLLYYVVPEARGSGIPQVKVAYASKHGRARFRDSLGKFVVGALQIGTGSSLGREGPTVQICAGVATGLSRLSGISDRNVRRMIPVGAAAGIAAAFNAPIAAVTFTIEEVVGTLDQTLLSGVIVAAAIAAVVERSVLGENPVFSIPEIHGLDSPSSLLLYAFLGVLAALISVAFTRALLGLRGWFRRRRALPRWAHPAMGGLVTGGLAVAALALFHTGGITGGGYVLLDDALSGNLAIEVLVVLCGLKTLATIWSYGTGGAGGLFAPALFIGGMLGGAVGFLDVELFGHPHAVVGSFALVGMGAVFSGMIRAPITSVLIIFEMTSGYPLILPLMIANMSAYGLARRLFGTTIYEALLEQDGIHLGAPQTPPTESIDSTPLGEFPALDRDFVTFYPMLNGTKMLRDSAQAGRQDVFPVLDQDERLVGVIRLEDLAILASEPLLQDGLVTAADIMRPPISIEATQTLRAAYEMMLANTMRELPVIDDDHRVIALIDEVAIAHAYLRARRAQAARLTTTQTLSRSTPPPDGGA